MKTILYYFSGRGNSFHTARSLSERIEGSSIISMAHAKEIDGSADIIGIITPVIDLGIPSFVRSFIKTMQASPKKPYVFAVVTAGGIPAGSLYQIKSLLARQGFTLSSGFLQIFGLEAALPEEWEKRMDVIASVVRLQTVLPLEKTAIKFWLLGSFGNRVARLIIPGEDKKFNVSETCDGCGICAKVCPVQNICLMDGKPVWQHHCTQCAACFGWCPKQAVGGTNLAAKTHYTNPNVTLQQILKP